MSKSLGNIVTIREALAETPGEVIRLALLSTHYRKPLDWTATGLEEAGLNVDKLYNALRIAGPAVAAIDDNVDPEVEDALCDDLNTPLALRALYRFGA